MKRFLFWTPRILCLVLAGFISLFALDVFEDFGENGQPGQPMPSRRQVCKQASSSELRVTVVKSFTCVLELVVKSLRDSAPHPC